MILFHCHSASENCSASIETTGACTCSSFFCADFVVCCGETRATAAPVECLSKNLNMSVVGLHWRCCLLISAEGCVSNFKMLLCTATKVCVCGCILLTPVSGLRKWLRKECKQGQCINPTTHMQSNLVPTNSKTHAAR